MNFRSYSEFAIEAERRLNNLVHSPVTCTVYESVKGTINRVRVSVTLPQINLIFIQQGSRLEQSILYFCNGRPQLRFENLEHAQEFERWQYAIEEAFKQIPNVNIACPEDSMIETVAEEIEELTEEAVKDAGNEPDACVDVPFIADEPETVVEDPVQESGEPTYEITELDEAFVIWALENLRTLNEDKATFKKDIPEEFAHMAATKRTITDGDILAMLVNRVPVEEASEE